MLDSTFGSSASLIPAKAKLPQREKQNVTQYTIHTGRKTSHQFQSTFVGREKGAGRFVVNAGGTFDNARQTGNKGAGGVFMFYMP